MSVSIQISARVNGVTTWFDITEDLANRGAKIPASVSVPGIYPDDLTSSDDEALHYDLLGAINDHKDTRLRENFFDGKVHGLKIVDSHRGAFDCRILLETRYGSRNA